MIILTFVIFCVGGLIGTGLYILFKPKQPKLNYTHCTSCCEDPMCKQVGCLDQPAWKFRQDIIFSRDYKERRKNIRGV